MGGGTALIRQRVVIQVERRRILAQQHRNRMLGLGALQANVGGLSARRFQLCLRLSNIGQRRGAPVIEILGQLQRPRIVLHRLIEQSPLGVL